MFPQEIMMSFKNLKMLAIVAGVILTASLAGHTMIQQTQAINADGWDANGVNAGGDDNRVASAVTDGSSGLKDADGANGIGTPGKDAIGTPGNDGIGTPGKGAIGTPGKDGIGTPGKDGIGTSNVDETGGIKSQGTGADGTPGAEGIPGEHGNIDENIDADEY
jgi:hypothetical protein